MSTIGVAIPCYKPHYPLLSDLLKNIEASTRIPDQVVISCSSWDYDAKVVLTQYSFPVTILFTKNVQNQAKNRNLAASQLNTDFISFIDADDRMHPKRLEIVFNILQSNPGIDAIYHAYVYQNNYNYTFTDEDATSSIMSMCPDPHEPLISLALAPIHHAHVTIRANVIQNVKFNEDPSAYRIEDCLFARAIHAAGFHLKYIPFRLTLYKSG